ncbi:aggregation-promoting factor C-terminal-like domain-containing protein [Streptomyces tsukubensis]|uniref:aggregation-promoting factor C-terminal-like domain-containing protein n=1 Tax=Streptomyces tsukubensis TaxID=83656 RepID=UPI003690A224
MLRSATAVLRRPSRHAFVGAALVATSAAMVVGLNPASAAAAPAAAPASVPAAVEAASAKAVAQKMIGDDAQFQCFSQIVAKESNWDVQASNPSSGAYGLVQALPANKMATAGSDWKTNPETQIEWGLNYMQERYGSPCAAWAKWQTQGWY